MDTNAADKSDQQLQDKTAQEARWDGDNIYYCYYRFNQIEAKKVHMKITELEEESYCKTEESVIDDKDRMEIPIQFEPRQQPVAAAGDYTVEEPEETPFDFVFEPDHYKSGHKHNEHCKVHSDTLSTCSSMSSTSNGATRMEEDETPGAAATAERTKSNGKRKLDDASPSSASHETNLQETPGERTAAAYPVHRAARFKGERDGILEYEYLSHRYTKPPPSQQIHLDEQSTETDVLNYNYYNEFDLKHHHLNAVVRGISLVKWPGIGFGFGITRSTNQNYIYVNEIRANSPAEFSLQVGDIILEIDERCPEKDFSSLDEIYEHLNRAEFVHLLVIHESKYFNLELAPSKPGTSETSRSFYENNEWLRDFSINCQDIVVVSWPKTTAAAASGDNTVTN